MTVTGKEVARHRIRVAGIAPGYCETRLVAGMSSKSTADRACDRAVAPLAWRGSPRKRGEPGRGTQAIPAGRPSPGPCRPPRNIAATILEFRTERLDRLGPRSSQRPPAIRREAHWAGRIQRTGQRDGLHHAIFATIATNIEILAN
jgi:NAD(P)-dependent dehydrogenase (short-subunit alcohol dehydrogenase family)